MAKKYTLNVTKRGSRPRSERLRKLGGTTVAGGGSTVINVTTSPVVPGDTNGHTHANKSTLDKFSVDENSYLYIDQLRETEDGTGYSTIAEKVKSGYADKADYAAESGHSKEADNADKWDSRQFDDYLDQPVRKTDSVQHKEIITDTLRGAGQFVDGLLGSGYRLWVDGNGIVHLTIDRLTVRQTMVVLELQIEQIRSVGGQIVVSAANGKIKDVEVAEECYRITFEQENRFVAHDLVRCQTFTGNAIKSYWVEVSAVEDNAILVPMDEFEGVVPLAGDECVLMGNTENTARQNLILISATEDGQPRIDVMNGVKSKSFAGCLRARFGNLDGISDTWFPSDKQPHGDGIYCDNAYLRGTFVLETGEDIKTKFEITEGKIQAAVTGIRQDFLGENGYLNNAAFADGMDKWTAENETVFFLVGNKWVWANNNVLSKKGNSASVTTDDGRVVVRIRNKYILQKYANLRAIPEMGTTSEGEKTAMPVYLSFFYRCAEAGTLKIGFENVDKTGFAEFDSFSVEEQLEATDVYKQYTCSGLWNGTGDFKLSFTGDIYLYMLVLSTDKVESLTYQYKTLFEQSEKLVKIAALNFDIDGNVLESSSIITTSKFNELMSARFNEDGSLKNTAGIITTTNMESMLASGELVSSTTVQNMLDGLSENVVHIDAFATMFASAVDENGLAKTAQLSAYVAKVDNGDGSYGVESGIVLKADQIKLEGLVTANGNFKILEDGSIETTNGKFTGEINATKGYIGGFEISSSHIGIDNSIEGNTGMFLYSDMLGFNGVNRQMLIGTLNLMGYSYLGRMYDEVQDTMPRRGLSVGVRGVVDDNIALELTGGYVSGLNEKSVSYAFGYVTNETQPTQLDVNLDRSVVNVYVSTQFYWRKQATDSNGNAVDYSTKTRNVYINLPPVKQYDDGHIIRIRRAVNSGSTVYIVPGKSYRLALADGWTNTYEETEGNSVILTGADTYQTASSPLTLGVGETAEFVFIRDLSVTIDSVKYQGVWVKL